MTHCRYILMVLMLLASLSARAQTVYGYNFTTGVDSSMWITLTNPDTIRTYNQGQSIANTPEVELDFPFGFFGTAIHSLSVHYLGFLMCNNISNLVSSLYYWASCSEDPVIYIFGRMNSSTVSSMVLCQTVGSPGNRTLVCEISRKLNPNALEESRYQIQLDEGTCALRFVYGYNTFETTPVIGEIGFTGTNGRFIYVSPITHGVYTGGYSQASLSWPGNNRYYQFVPNCANLPRINISSVEQTSARVSWPQMGCASRYLVRYGCPDCGYSEFSTTDTIVHLVGLQQATCYEVQVRVVCRNGDTSEVKSRSFCTAVPSCSNIPYTSLYSNNFVKCRTGTYAHPSTLEGVVDYGYGSILSRHTVHYNTSERDPRTGNMLRTVPAGHCSSVRLGNWDAGGEQESITYTLHVDTNSYDLLILRYAIVEEDPSHPIECQPYVIFSVTDSAGNLIDSCDYAIFISGNLSGWNQYYYGSRFIAWRDWAAFGVSLSEFHDQDIQVTISNYDCCGRGAHFGYVYFTLEGAMKRLSSTVCGNNVENTFHAPQGFNYRWYRTDDPSLTLSTADTLHVTDAGFYYCQASYQLAGRDCSFTMSIRAGTRYPVAQFNSFAEDSCSAVRHFVNQSVVATDALHTHLTNEPCERYLWRFSDGVVDSATNVIRTFGNGTYTVTLIAMLANGDCVDSTTQTFSVSIPSDTVSVTLCWGEPYLFYGTIISEPGRYSYIEDCFEHLLFYNVFSHPMFLFDTICHGDTLFFGQQICVDSGLYTQVYTDQYGCDSIINLQLSCMPSYRIELRDTLPVGGQYSVGDTSFSAPGQYSYKLQTLYGCDSLFEISLSCTVHKDTTICSSCLPFTWDGNTFTVEGIYRVSYTNQAGTDSIVTYTLHVREQAVPQWTLDQSCDSGRYFIVEVGGGYRYQWYANGVDNSVEVIEVDSLYYINPPTPMVYYLQADYAEGLSCPATDSIYLNPADLLPVSIDFSVSPEYPTSETPTITLLDQSHNIFRREWYVNGLLQSDTGVQIECGIPFSSDSMVVCLIGYRTLCFQTLCKSIPIEHKTIYFPNVFTPDGDINNRFTAIGVGIAEFEMWIYDRRGALMFHTTDMQQGWDGTSGAIKCRQEAYAYTCRYRFKHQLGYMTHTGTVLLLR